jgi:multiple antibiotic resistance protein
MNVLALATTFFLVFDPFGNVAVFHALLAKLPENRRRPVLIREMLIALAVMVLFLLLGERLLGFLGLDPPALSISGGIILFLIALGMLFPARSIMTESDDDDEPFIVPMAVPMFAGPSAIALLLLTTTKHPDRMLEIGAALGLAWIGSAAILLLSPLLMRFLGRKGTRALERLMGLLLILVSVQMFLDGLADYQSSLAP